MTRWIVFDAMGVIFEEADDIIKGLVPFLHRRGFTHLDPEAVHSVYRRASLGQIPPREFWKQIGLEDELPSIETEYLDACLQLDPDFITTAEKISRDYSLAVLSNDIAEWSARMRSKHNLDRLFQEVVISGEVGVRKPAPEIYRILLDRLGANGKDCVFIDDRIPNLSAAVAYGIVPVWMVKGDEPPKPEFPHRIRSLSELPSLIENIFPLP